MNVPRKLFVRIVEPIARAFEGESLHLFLRVDKLNS